MLTIFHSHPRQTKPDYTRTVGVRVSPDAANRFTAPADEELSSAKYWLELAISNNLRPNENFEHG